MNDQRPVNLSGVVLLSALVGAGVAVGVWHYAVQQPGCATGQHSPPLPYTPPQPYVPAPVVFKGYRGPQPDGSYWRYEGDRVIGRWWPTTSVYEAWTGTQWVRAAPPIGDLPPGKEK